jgi:hypothetical protein
VNGRALIAAAVIASALVLPAAASAAPQTATCRFDGATGFTSASGSSMRGMLSGTGGSGYFTWTATAACVVTLPSGAVISTAANLGSANDVWANTYCGTFKVWGRLEIGFNDPRAASLTRAYELQVVSHEGVMRLTSNGADTGAGEVTWLPQNVQCLTDVPQFTMRGTLTVTA